ncbi:hypothetical protein [Chloroflexus sp.]|uniref:hypothetical protein n=1 Tax=Chloroflexus sp. TaxID=1904827 RepID=UPI003C750F9C
MQSKREREAIIVGSAVGTTAFIISVMLVGQPLWINLLVVIVAGSALCGLAILFD